MVLAKGTRVQRSVGVLLGGSGRPRKLPLTQPQVSALLKPALPASGQVRRP